MDAYVVEGEEPSAEQILAQQITEYLIDILRDGTFEYLFADQRLVTFPLTGDQYP